MAGLPAKVQLHEKYKKQGLDVITVNVEGEKGMQRALEALQKHSITTTNWCLIEAMNEEVEQALNIDMIPALHVYDRKGRLREAIVGELKHDEVERRIGELLREG